MADRLTNDPIYLQLPTLLPAITCPAEVYEDYTFEPVSATSAEGGFTDKFQPGVTHSEKQRKAAARLW
jgi:hypothetical protein